MRFVLVSHLGLDEHTVVGRKQRLSERAVELEHLHRVDGRVDDEQISFLVRADAVRT